VFPAIVLLAACSTQKAARGPLRTIHDDLGRPVEVVTVPHRIVSLAPSITESLFEIGSGDSLVGVTTYCDYPPEAAAIEKVGDTQRPSLERIIGLKPDLVVASTSSQLETFVGRLESLGTPVFVSNPRDLEGVLKSLEILGDLTTRTEAAREAANRLRARIELVRSRVAGRARPRVLLLLGGQPLITVGGTTFVSGVIRDAGGESISADAAGEYPQFNLETALARQPEIIFLQNGDEGLPERLKETPAFRTGRVHRLDDALLLRPGPRLVDGLEQMAARIHPEAFAASR
jgi:iron complex transport system substrate-binding protein